MAEKKVILAKSAGFCFGVHRAVDTVYERTDKKNVYTYGPIIHNEEVVKDLESKGVKAISDISDIDTGVDGNATVIIRSHGVSKSVYDSIRSKNYEIVDATCPFVRKIHKIVEKAGNDGDQVIIVGSEHHPEVQGIKGWCTGEVHIISDAEQFEGIDLNKPTTLVSQTTFNYNKFKELVEIIAKALVDNPDEVVVKETIDGDTITIELNVAGDDMGKVIGKQGRIAKSIRAVVKAAATKEDKKVIVDIM